MPTKLKKKAKQTPESYPVALPITGGELSAQTLQDLELDLLGIPLEAGVAFPELEGPQRILFQRCTEIYRIADLFSSKRELMLNVFSEYRTRTQFEAVLRTHYFETDERLTPAFDPEFYTYILGAYHFIRSLSLSLKHTESLPTTLEQELIWAESNLIRTWNRISQMARAKYGWKFKSL